MTIGIAEKSTKRQNECFEDETEKRKLLLHRENSEKYTDLNMSTSLGKRDRDDDDNKEDDDPELNFEAPPSRKKQRTVERHNGKESGRSDRNGTTDSLSGVSSPPIVAVSKVITLNVGGIKYTTTLSTLTGYESMLKARFSGNYSMEPMNDGSYFFDRNGDLFQYILEYLRTGKVLIPETWNRVELYAFYVEVQYFAVTSLLKLLSLRFFDSKIVTHDAMKQKLITTISNEAKDAYFKRDVFPTKDWVLRFDYNQFTETQRDHKKAQLLEIMYQAHLTLTLILADGHIYGRLKPTHFDKTHWMACSDDVALTFRWPSPENLLRPQDPSDAELYIRLLPGNCAMTDEEKEKHESKRHWFWISALHPYAVAATKANCYVGDFTIKAIDKADATAKFVQRIEVWNIPSSYIPSSHYSLQSDVTSEDIK